MTKNCLHCQKPIEKSNPNHRKMRYCSLPCFHASLRKTPEQVFWPKVNKDGAGGCWEWTAALQRDGYAHFINPTNRKTISAHRYAYEQLVGPIPADMDLLHSCDNRKCVNPAHLRPGTHAENMREAKQKRRHVHGARNIHALLTEAQALEILANPPKLGRGGNVAEYAARYRVTEGAILHLVAGRTWKHLHEERHEQRA